MKARTWLWLGLLGLMTAVLALLGARSPRLDAQIRWSVETMLHPPGAGGRPLQ